MFTRKINSMLMVSGLLMMLVFAGCKKSSYYQLTDEDMSWLVYKNNEINYFVNSQNDTRAFLVTLRTKSYKMEGDTYNEFTTASFTQLADTTALLAGDDKGLLYISKDVTGLKVTLSWPHFPIKNVVLTNIFPSAATIGGINYIDVFVLDGSPYTDSRNYLSRVWYSKSAGVIQFEERTGEIWVRTI